MQSGDVKTVLHGRGFRVDFFFLIYVDGSSLALVILLHTSQKKEALLPEGRRTQSPRGLGLQVRFSKTLFDQKKKFFPV